MSMGIDIEVHDWLGGPSKYFACASRLKPVPKHKIRAWPPSFKFQRGASCHNQLDNAPRDIGTERHPKILAADTGFVEHVVPRGLPVCLEQLCVSWPT